MNSEPSLPPLPPSTAGNRSNTSRKRSYSHEWSSSSDPPLFSSDDPLTSTSDNYLQRRKKRRYQGTWWSAEKGDPRSAQHGRRVYVRTVDSGVWMSSEEPEFSDDGAFDGVTLVFTERSQATGGSRGAGRTQAADGPDTEQPLAAVATGGERSPGQTAEQCAESIIQQCLEDGKESVDLSGLQLTCVSNAAISSLRSLTNTFVVEYVAPSQEAYFPLAPLLKLYLSRNLLHTLPSAVMTLENLNVLSLRNNKLRELPPAIGRLTNLVELNVGGNRLQWLPWEILGLMGQRGLLTRFSVHRNPFIERVKSDGRDLFAKGFRPGPSANPSQPETTEPHVKIAPSFAGVSSVQYFELDGAPRQQAPPAASSVPSLLELSLRSCSSSQSLPYLSDLLPEDSPQTLRRLISDTQSLNASGGQCCSVCGHEFIIPQTEWIEWWDISSQSSFEPSPSEERPWRYVEEVPLRRRGCSWNCVAPASEYMSR